jgi:hypothetical protein
MEKIKPSKGYFRLLFFWFFFWGPLIGCFVLDYWIDLELMDDGHILAILPFAYILGLFPALSAALINGMLLVESKNRKKEITVLSSLGIGAFSGFITSIIFSFVLIVLNANLVDKSTLIFISVFVIPGALCGVVINKEASRMINS